MKRKLLFSCLNSCSIRALIKSFLVIFILTPGPLCAESFKGEDPTSAKTIAKPILMLMLYCHSAFDTLYTEYEKDQKTDPVLAQVGDYRAFTTTFQVNRNELGAYNAEKGMFSIYVKSVTDGAISYGEAKFLDLTARKDAQLWINLAKNTCKKHPFFSIATEDDECLRNINSEIFKCYQGFNQRAQVLKKLP